MSFIDILNKHNEHNVIVKWKLHKNKIDPKPGLYCSDCNKLIKWVSVPTADELIDAGVEEVHLSIEEQMIYNRRLIRRGYSRVPK